MPLPRPLPRVPGTSRQRVITNGGTELQRQQIYMPEEVWESLRLLAAEHRTSGSQVITRLIQIASMPSSDNSQIS